MIYRTIAALLIMAGVCCGQGQPVCCYDALGNRVPCGGSASSSNTQITQGLFGTRISQQSIQVNQTASMLRTQSQTFPWDRMRAVVYITHRGPGSGEHSILPTGEEAVETANNKTGSGTVIKCQDGLAYVLTCSHIIGGPSYGPLIIEGCNYRSEKGKLISADGQLDLALLSFPYTRGTVDIFQMDVVPNESPVGSRLNAKGVPGGVPKAFNGPLVKYVGDYVYMSGFATDGMSGGPIHNEQGLVSVIATAEPGKQQTYGARTTFIRQFLVGIGYGWLIGEGTQTPPSLPLPEPDADWSPVEPDGNSAPGSGAPLILPGPGSDDDVATVPDKQQLQMRTRHEYRWVEPDRDSQEWKDYVAANDAKLDGGEPSTYRMGTPPSGAVVRHNLDWHCAWIQRNRQGIGALSAAMEINFKRIDEIAGLQGKRFADINLRVDGIDNRVSEVEASNSELIGLAAKLQAEWASAATEPQQPTAEQPQGDDATEETSGALILYYTSRGCTECAPLDAKIAEMKKRGWSIVVTRLSPEKAEVQGVPRMYIPSRDKHVVGINNISSYLSNLVSR